MLCNKKKKVFIKKNISINIKCNTTKTNLLVANTTAKLSKMFMTIIAITMNTYLIIKILKILNYYNLYNLDKTLLNVMNFLNSFMNNMPSSLNLKLILLKMKSKKL